MLNNRLDPRYSERLTAFGLRALEEERGVCYATDPAFRIVYFNPAYAQYAADNGAPGLERRWGLGAYILEPVPDVLREAVVDVYNHAIYLHRIGALTPALLPYECSSPSQYRLHALHLYALGCGGHVAVHSIRVKRPHDRPDGDPDENIYRTRNGFLRQCANCRRFSRADGGGWDWISAWVAAPRKDVSHGLCPICRSHFYGDTHSDL